jgi:hypothetical protein
MIARSAILVFIVQFISISLAAEEIEVEVHNLSDAPVNVALAFRSGPQVSSKGWFEIKPAEKRRFKSDWRNGMCLRVEQNGEALRFKNYSEYRGFLAIRNRFEVSNTDVPSVVTLRWGPMLENIRNMRMFEPLPDGWGVVPFLVPTKPGKHHLEILSRP